MAKFEIVIRNQGQAGGGSSGRGSTNPAKQAEADAKKAEAAAKRYAAVQEAAYNKIAATQARQAKSAADAQAREAKRAADAIEKESKRAANSQIKEAKRAADQIASFQKAAIQKNRFSFQGAGSSGIAGLDKTFGQRAAASKAYAASVSKDIDAIFSNWEKESRKEEALAVKVANTKIREDQRAAKEAERAAAQEAKAVEREAAKAAQARSRFRARAGQAIGGAATSIGYGAYRAAGQAGNGIGNAGRELASGGITGILGSAPRAAGDLLQGAGQAAASLSRGFGVALSKLLPGALGFIGKAVGNAFAVVGELAGALGQAAGQIAGFIGDKLGLALKVTLGAAVGVAVLGIKQAFEQEDVGEAFDTLAVAAGETATGALEKLQKATRGMIPDLALQTQAVKAVRTETVASIPEYAELAEVAVQLGKSINIGPTEALEDFTAALVSGNAKGLKQYLGTAINFDAVVKQLAKSQGVEVEALDDALVKHARLNAVMKVATDQARKLGPQVDNASDSFERLKATAQNVLNFIGKPLIRTLQPVFDYIEKIARAIGDFFKNNNEAIAKSLNTAIGGIVGNLKDLPAIIRTIKLDQVFTLAQLQAKKLWVEFTVFAKAAADATVDLFIAGFSKIKAAAIRLLPDPTAFYDDKGNLQSPTEARAKELDSEASGLVKRAGGRFTNAAASLGSNPQITALNAQLEALRKVIEDQAAGRPTIVAGGGGGGGDPSLFFGSKYGPQVSNFGGFGGGTSTGGGAGASFDVSGANTGTLGPDIFTQAAALNGYLRLLNAGLESAVAELDLTDEQLAQISENFRRNDIAEDFERYKKEQTAGLKAGLDAAEQQKKYWEDTISELGSAKSIQEQFGAKLQQVYEDEIAERERLNQDFAAKREDIIGGFKAAMDEIASRVGQLSGSLSSAAGFGGEFGGADLDKAIPGKFKRAARKRTRRATKALRHELNQQGAGLGDDDLINGGAEQIFQNVAQKQVLGAEGGANAAQKALDEALNRLSDIAREKDAQLADLADKTGQTIEILQQTEERELEALNAAIEKLEAIAETQANFEKRLAKAEKDIEAIPTSPGR